MPTSTRPCLLLSAALLAIAVTPGTSAAKCVESIGHPVRPGYVLIVDGELMGEYAMGMEADADRPEPEEIHAIRVTCIDAPRANGARQAAVMIVTKRGATRLLTSYLGDLVVEQEKYRARHGSFAPDLATLRFLESRYPVEIDMRVEPAGWTATARVEGLAPLCEVAVGSVGGGPREASARPRCGRS